MARRSIGFNLQLPQIVKHFLTISTGVALGQALAFAAMPVISRLYSPADFGVLGTATSLSGVIATAAALQYPQALVLPRRNAAAINLLAVSLFSSLVISIVTSVAFSLISLTGCSRIVPYPVLFWSVPVLVFFAGANQSLQAWCVRRKAFQRTAISPIVRSASLVCVQIGWGLCGAATAGLIYGAMLGEGAANINLARQVIKDDLRLFLRSVRVSRMKRLAWSFRDVARHATLQNFISTTSISMPVLFLSYFSSITTTGYYSLAMRTLQVPMVLIVSALRQVLLQRMAEHQHNNVPLASISKKSILLLASVTIPSGLIFFFVAPHLFSFLYGRQWYEAGEYARWLTPWIVSSFCNAPCLIAAQVLRLQKLLLYFEVITLCGRAAALAVGIAFFPPTVAIAVLSITSSILNVSLALIIFGRVKQRDYIMPCVQEVMT